MNKLKLWTGIILVFVLGALAGSFGTGMYIKHVFTQFAFEKPGEGPPPPPPVMRFLMRRLESRLDLTGARRAEIEKIMEESMEEFHNIRRNYQPELSSAVEKFLERIKEKLSAEQQEKLDKFHSDLKERWQHRRGFGPRSAHEMSGRLFSGLKDSLDLSDVQEKQVRPIIEAGVEERQKIFETHFGKDHNDRLAVRKEMDELRVTTERKLKKILTEEQMNKYREISEEHRRHKREEMRTKITNLP